MITLKYFANLKEVAGKAEEHFQQGSGMSLENFSELIGQTQPKIAEMIREKKIMVSVNQEMATLDTIIQDGDEIAVLPPFSGGS